jgi:peptide-methionine (R)-S-oxide reductase
MTREARVGKRDTSPPALRERLDPRAWHVTQEKGTEPPFSGELLSHDGHGTYACVCCGAALFHSEHKYDSGSGWPSFTEAIDPAKVTLQVDRSHGMIRTEAICATCGAHLGHVFPDGPGPSGDRFCMNSASLDLKPAD